MIESVRVSAIVASHPLILANGKIHSNAGALRLIHSGLQKTPRLAAFRIGDRGRNVRVAAIGEPDGEDA